MLCLYRNFQNDLLTNVEVTAPETDNVLFFSYENLLSETMQQNSVKVSIIVPYGILHSS